MSNIEHLKRTVWNAVDDLISEYIKADGDPEDLFSREQLDTWAIHNGYIKAIDSKLARCKFCANQDQETKKCLDYPDSEITGLACNFFVLSRVIKK